MWETNASAFPKVRLRSTTGNCSSPRSSMRFIHSSFRSIMSLTFALEKEVAVAAVMRACSLTSSVFNNLIKGETLSKDDKSPVTGLYAP